MNKYVLLIVLIALLSNNAVAAKKECAELLNKFHNIQAKQRQGQSIKNSNSLREKEDLARERWWDCENNKSPSKKKKYKKKKKSVVKNASSNYNSNAKIYNRALKPIKSFSSNKVVLKGRYSGDKQFKWLAFYKRPKKCGRPKTTQVFAYCMDHKEKQQMIFEQQYKSNK